MSMNEDRFAGTAKNWVAMSNRIWTRHWRRENRGRRQNEAGRCRPGRSQAKDAAGDAYRQAKHVGRCGKVCAGTRCAVGEFLRNAIKSRPYTSVAVALGLGWFIGRMGGHSDY